MAYLDDHRTAVPQQRKPRRQTARVIVKHTTEQPADLAGADWNAENLAKWLKGSTRPASYHRVDDRDSSIRFRARERLVERFAPDINRLGKCRCNQAIKRDFPPPPRLRLRRVKATGLIFRVDIFGRSTTVKRRLVRRSVSMFC